MPRFWGLLLLSASAFAATVPNTYIVELSLEPVAVHAAATPSRLMALERLHTAEAEQRRAAIRVQQAAARTAIEQSGGRILSAVHNVANALIIEIPDARAAALASAPGVLAVHPVRLFEMSLDHALPLHHVPDAWTQAGFANAGAGIRIGIIDTGIEISHAGFNDAGFTAPPGFPMADVAADLAFTNNKVIVARSYASLFTASDPDPSARDHVGHGTGTAMAAAGVSNTSVLTTITGVAPQAYLGVYKVFGTPGVNDNASEAAIITALDDAVNDGMNIINMSLGYNVASNVSFDPFVKAVEAASSVGVIVVASAGNNGPDPGTVSSPATAPHAIAAGASSNDRVYAGSVQTGALLLTSLPGGGLNSFTPLSGPLTDVSTLDSSGLACDALPAGALQGAIVLISRGSCTFATKLNNAQASGAVAAVIYDNVPGEALVLMGVGAAPLPGAFVSNADGLTLKAQAAAAPPATVQFYAPIHVDPQRLASFSATGPNINYSVKPDLVAVGESLYTAAETVDSAGLLYNPSGYTTADGTSFAAPLVSGAAAIVEAARPGLTSDEYRSLLIDTADTAYLSPGIPSRVQQSGGGFLNVLSALNATAVASPVSLSFTVSPSETSAGLTLVISNVGSSTDTFQLSATAHDPGAPVPQLPTTAAQIQPGASLSIPVQFSAAGLPAGQYEGFLVIQGASASVPTRVPYWIGVGSGTPAYVTVLLPSTGAKAGSSVVQAAIFHITDSAGLPVSLALSASSGGLPVTGAPTATVVSGGGHVTGITPLASPYPGDYVLSVTLGPNPGPNVFQIKAGIVSSTVTITGQ
jgi:subtilisin family serine protease